MVCYELWTHGSCCWPRRVDAGRVNVRKLRLGHFCAIVRGAIVPFCGWWRTSFDVSAARVVCGSALARAMWAEVAQTASRGSVMPSSLTVSTNLH
ncbi:hypothetical protein IG631_06145 [Alternaria alternata]|nr:hypothetical protein IG631_06145 [Alternaria alternata]